MVRTVVVRLFAAAVLTFSATSGLFGQDLSKFYEGLEFRNIIEQ